MGSNAIDTLQGLYHFLTDRTPSAIPVVSPKPRRTNPYLDDGFPLVSKVKAGDLRDSVQRSLDLLGGPGKVLTPGMRVMVKPNYNSPDPYPASTDLGFLRTVIELLLEFGVRVSVGESAGGVWRPSRKTMSKAGALDLLEHLGVETVVFDDRPRDWVTVRVDGEYLKKVTVPRAAYEADRLVYIPCMKTHNLARFSLSLKLAMGFVHPGERRAMHMGNLEKKVAEINLVWQPDLIIMDGRKSFVTGGPSSGETVSPSLIMASGDQVAIDVEALNILGSYQANNRLLDDPWDSPQIVQALRHGLGAPSRQYRVVG